MIVVIKQFGIMLVNVDYVRAFEEIIYLFFNNFSWSTMLVSYKKNS